MKQYSNRSKEAERYNSNLHKCGGAVQRGIYDGGKSDDDGDFELPSFGASKLLEAGVICQSNHRKESRAGAWSLG
jgi:hypothetical protein